MTGIRNKFVRGIRWSFAQQAATQVINYVSVFWLASLVTPVDFGKVALAVVLIGIFSSVNGFGIGELIIRDDVRDERKISTYFWAVCLLSFFLALLCSLAGLVYSLFFDVGSVAEFRIVIVVSSVALVNSGINSVYNSLYSRDLDFKSTARFFVLSLLLGNVASIVGAYFGFGFWALILKNVLPLVFLTVCFWLSGKYKVGFYFDKSCIQGSWSFTSNITYFNALNFLVRNLDYIVIGKFFDLATVGQYSIAYKIMIFPLKNLTARIHSVLYPVLSKLKDNLSSLEQTYLRVVEGLSYVAFPISVLISVLAPVWVPIVFDVSVYDQLIPLVRILSIVGAAQAITSPVMSLYLIAGRTKALFVVGIVVALVNGVGFVVGGLSGSIQYFAVVYAIVQLTISIPVSNFVPYRLLSFNFIRFMKGISVPLIASVILYASIYFSLRAGSDFPMVLQLLVSVLLGLMIYAVSLVLLAGPQLKVMYSMFRSILSRG